MVDFGGISIGRTWAQGKAVSAGENPKNGWIAAGPATQQNIKMK